MDVVTSNFFDLVLASIGALMLFYMFALPLFRKKSPEPLKTTIYQQPTHTLNQTHPDLAEYLNIIKSNLPSSSVDRTQLHLHEFFGRIIGAPKFQYLEAIDTCQSQELDKLNGQASDILQGKEACTLKTLQALSTSLANLPGVQPIMQEQNLAYSVAASKDYLKDLLKPDDKENDDKLNQLLALLCKAHKQELGAHDYTSLETLLDPKYTKAWGEITEGKKPPQTNILSATSP